jgi:hypothetical protein
VVVKVEHSWLLFEKEGWGEFECLSGISQRRVVYATRWKPLDTGGWPDFSHIGCDLLAVLYISFLRGRQAAAPR